MRFESYRRQFMDGIERQFDLALQDAADESRARPGAPSDLHSEVTGRLRGRIGSRKPYALAQEKGAFITPRNARALRFASGRFSMSARIRPKRYLESTGRRWGRILISRLRQGAT